MHGYGQPFAIPNFFIVVGICLAGLILVPMLLWRALGHLVAGPLEPGDRRLRRLGWLTGAAALSVYTWGALHLVLDETAASDACHQVVRAAAGRNAEADISAYRTTYVPLGFGCQVRGRGTFEAAVPAYVNPTAFGLAALGVLFVQLDRLAGGRRAADAPTAGS